MTSLEERTWAASFIHRVIAEINIIGKIISVSQIYEEKKYVWAYKNTIHPSNLNYHSTHTWLKSQKLIGCKLAMPPKSR